MTRTPSASAVFAAIIGLAATLSGPARSEDTDLSRFEQIEREAELIAHRRLARVRTPDTSLIPFTTDGCSGGMSAVWNLAGEQFPELTEIRLEKPPWEDCCITHDDAYHQGGPDPDPAASFAARLEADRQLRSCVASRAAEHTDDFSDRYGLSADDTGNLFATVSRTMYFAVRLGGGPCTGLPWRWGYGWPACHVFAD